MFSVLRKLLRLAFLFVLGVLLFCLGTGLTPAHVGLIVQDTLTRNRPAPLINDVAPRVNALAAPQRIVWPDPETDAADAAPALTLLMQPGDIVDYYEKYDLWRPGREAVIDLPRLGPRRLNQVVLVPNAESFPLSDLTPFCGAPLQGEAFSGCKASRGILTLYGETPSGPYALLTDTQRQASRADLSFASRLQRQTRYVFFTERKDGRSEFAGWDCSSNELQTVLQSGALHRYSRCVAPLSPMQRLLPFLPKPEPHNALLACGKYDDCQLYFLFQGRVAHLTVTYVPPTMPEAGMLQLLVSAWTRLERQYTDTNDAAIAAAREKAEALTQSETCIALATEAEAARASVPLQNINSKQSNGTPCRKAAFLIARLAERDPATAAPLFSRLIPVLVTMDRINSFLARELFPLWLASLEKSGKANSPEIQAAMTLQLQYVPSQIQAPAGPNRRPGEHHFEHPASDYDNFANHEREAFLRKAWAMALQLKSTPPEARDTAFKALAWHLEATKQPAALAALYQEKWRFLKTQAPADPLAQLDTVMRLAFKQWRINDFVGMRASVAELEPLWLTQAPAVATATASPAATQKLMKDTGFALVLLYSTWGQNQRKVEEAVAQQNRIMEKMAALYGENDAYLHAARCEQRYTTGASTEPHQPGCGLIGERFGPYVVWNIDQ